MVFLLRLQRLAALALALLLVQSNTLSAQQSSLKPVPTEVQQIREQGVRFEPVSSLFSPAGKSDPAAVRFAPDAQFLTLDQAALDQIMAMRPAAITLQLPYEGEIVTVDLVQHDVLTEDFFVSSSAREREPYVPGLHYRGIVHDDNRSLAAISFFDDEVMGIISGSYHGNLVLGRLETRDNHDDYILYSDAHVTERNPFTCATEDQDMKIEQGPSPDAPENVNGCVRVYFEADNALFQSKGTVEATVNYLAGAFSQLATLYANEQISVKLSQVFVWVSLDSYSRTSSSTALNQFKALRTSHGGDIAHLVGIGGNNLGGIAYVGVLCTPSFAYAYSDINTSYSNVPTFSWTVEVLTHEMGHNLGSNHTQWCGWTGGALDDCYTTEGGCPAGPHPSNGGTIMSYCHLSSTGINFNNGFGSQPGNKVRNDVSHATCLAATCTASNGCNAPIGIGVSGLTGTNATISWTSVSGATSYTLQWRAVGASTWNTVDNAVSPRALTGLPANDEVEVRLQANCGSNTSGYQNGVIFITGSGTGGGGGGGCGTPSGLTAAGTGTSSGSASWSAVSGASSYNVSWKASSGSTWGTTYTTTNTSYNVSGLQSGTSYDFRVQGVCSGTPSAYATTAFNTSASGGGGGGCSTPGNLAASSGTNSAFVSWGAVTGAFSYYISWKLNTSGTWGPSYSTSNTSFTIGGLQASTNYNVRVQAICSNGTSGYAPASFATTSSGGGGGGGCSTPASLLATNVVASSAVLTWGAVSGAIAYDLQIRVSTSTVWQTFIGLPVTSVQVTNLQPNRTYLIRVRAKCSSTTYSDYTAVVSFSTPAQLVGGGNSDHPITILGHGTALRTEPVDPAELTVETTRMTLAPNPAQDRVLVRLDLPEDLSGANVQLMDLYGKIIHAENFNREGRALELDLSDLPAGFYLIRASTGGQVLAVEKLIKQ